ncbi:hypothetical protein MTBLM5_280007 [Magnetospirillum sp. LM-5]|nr:hypothetical protein MTBLM5_280007 [Magnetospirillum sp. LM-5]
MGAAPVLHEDLTPRPNTLYGAAKLAGEHIVAQASVHGAGVIALRLSSLYGPGQNAGSVLPFFIERARAGQAIEVMAGGARTQDFLHVDDAAEVMVDAAASTATGVYNLGSGNATSMLELARTIAGLPRWNVAVVDRGGQESAPSVVLDLGKARRDWDHRQRISLAEGLKHYHDVLLEREP